LRVNCTQCGAAHTVLESDFFLLCPFCDARIVVNPPVNTPVMVVPSVSKENASRLFPPGAVSSTTLRYFPFLEEIGGYGLRPCFSQPWSEMNGYVPPAGDRRLFDESLADPEEIIPFDREMEVAGKGRIVFHPFFVVMLKLEGYDEGVLVDGVSGKLLGGSPLDRSSQEPVRSLFRLFLPVLAAGLTAALPVFFIVKAVASDRTVAAIAALLAASFAGRLVMRLLDGKTGGS
jgi:hypothetical protein